MFSTLHTNDAASAAVRLIDMGVDPYLITSTVRAFIAQRLVRVICRECRESIEGEKGMEYRGKGCRRCNNTGYLGRIGIFEFIMIGKEIERLILARASAGDVREKALELGMTTLIQDGWEKVARGITTSEEVRRVTYTRDL